MCIKKNDIHTNTPPKIRQMKVRKPHRWVTDEPEIPFDYTILYENARVIVIDKPHFLATTPRGMWYRNTALIRLREQFGNDDIIPAHRLDRATAGVVLFVKHVDDRGAYQMCFQRREVHKVYEALAPIPPEGQITFPCERSTRIVKERGVLQAREEEGVPNSHTVIEVAKSDTATTKDSKNQTYVLRPTTGKTHQLRVHMNGLGIPIVGDDLYPRVIDRPYDDFSSPLHLVARQLEMTDPISGDQWVFKSQFHV